MPELKWLKSSFSEASGNNCVEIASIADAVALRESEDPVKILTTERGPLLSLIRSLKGSFLPQGTSDS
ncbi:DUF397 domain-containing protein [Streptomyces sp. NPDC004542]|uniref:DUF397 domain-containing protein n=1 Tax=Streptomyces sp. NPDC004542 TaxID=3154281 RepID=UPI0033B8D2CF